MRRMIVFLLFFSFFVNGCGGNPAYRSVFREKAAYNSKKFPVSKDILFNAVLKAVYSKQFIVDKEELESGFILAKRVFQKGKKTTVLLIQAKITSDSEQKSALFINAIQTTERLFIADRTRFFMFIIPLPGGGGKEAKKITEEERQIEDRKFYNDFFSCVEKEVNLKANDKAEL